MKKYNLFWTIVGIICVLTMFVSSLYWEKQYHAIEEHLIAVSNEYKNQIQIFEQNCEDLIVKNSTLEEQLIANEEQLAKNVKLIEEANFMIDALKSEKYSVPYTISEKEIEMIAQTIWGEARGANTLQQSMVVWCILNRVDSGKWGNTVAEVIAAPDQFHGYSSRYPVTEEHKALARDVVTRWQIEAFCPGEVGRTLPAEYLYFRSDETDLGNIFRTEWSGNYKVWDPNSCWNPYS